MVFESIKALKERNGSSIQAIKKHITSSHPTLNFTPHQMRSALKKGTEAGKFIKVSRDSSTISLPLALAPCCRCAFLLRVDDYFRFTAAVHSFLRIVVCSTYYT